MGRIAKTISNHVEFWISAAGLIVIGLALLAMIAWADNTWQLIALAATGIAGMLGFGLLAVWARKCRVRKQAIREVQGVLKDQINNRLSVAVGVADLGSDPQVANTVARCAAEISELLDTVSEDTLRRWKDRYPHAFRHHR